MRPSLRTSWQPPRPPECAGSHHHLIAKPTKLASKTNRTSKVQQYHVLLALFEGDKRAHLQLDGRAVTLPKRISLSGPRYAKGDISLKITKTGITLKRGKQSTECITRSWVGSLLPARDA